MYGKLVATNAKYNLHTFENYGIDTKKAREQPKQILASWGGLMAY